MKIEIKEPDGPYSCEVDTDVMEVNIREAFIGPTFVTKDGERLVVIMRDNGFELIYSVDRGNESFTTAQYELKDGDVRVVKGLSI